MPYKASTFFRKQLKSKPPILQGAIARCIKMVTEEPKRPGLAIHRVQGTKGVWEAYVDAKNRVTFHYEGDLIVFLNHCNHDILKRRP